MEIISLKATLLIIISSDECFDWAICGEVNHSDIHHLLFSSEFSSAANFETVFLILRR